MEFECHGAHVRLHGAQHPTYIALTMTALKQQMRVQPHSQYFHLSIVMDLAGNAQITMITPSLLLNSPTSLIHSLQEILTSFTDIFFPLHRSSLSPHY